MRELDWIGAAPMTPLRPGQPDASDDSCNSCPGEADVTPQTAGPQSTVLVSPPPALAAVEPRAAKTARRWGAWLIPPCLAVAAAAGLVSAPPGSRGAAAVAPAANCHASDWQTTVTLDGSRPEMAMATLRSRNAVGPSDLGSCAEVRLACRREGPYFELRIPSPTLAMREVGPLQIRSLHDELSARAFQPDAGGEGAVRIADKQAVELIAFALANSLAFSVPITFTSGDKAVAEFKSYHFSTAVRPVLFACNMRKLQTDDDDDDQADSE